MELSKRIQGLTGGGPDGWDVFYKARAMAAAGQDVTDLTIGEHDRRTEPEILGAMHAAAKAGHTGYAPVPGTDSLRDKVAARIAAMTGIKTSRENVLIVTGGQAGLFAAHVAVCDPGDTGLFIDPYYATYPGTIRATGAQAKPVVAKAKDGFLPQVTDLAKAAGDARSLLINSPNNPTGVTYDRDTLGGIADVCRDHNLWLISDEVYDSQIWQGTHLSPRQLPDMAERTLVIGSLSKSHAMTGSRLGWVIGPEEVIAHMINLSTHTTYGVPGFIQMAGEYALDQGVAFENRIAQPFRHRHAAASRLLRGAGLPLVSSAASMYLMADVRATGLTGNAFANRLLDTHQIAVMPGESFGQSAAGHIRIALTVADNRLMAALDTLANFYTTLTERPA
jgi:arginine:pyruvate transaminase